MSNMPDFTSIKDLRYGEDPVFDAWLLHFMTANHLESSIDPVKNASPEQLSFMVALDDDQFLLPALTGSSKDWLHRGWKRICLMFMFLSGGLWSSWSGTMSRIVTSEGLSFVFAVINSGRPLIHPS